MSEEMAGYMAAPEKNGAPTLPRRAAPKGMLPSTWQGRSLRVEYQDGYGAAEVSGVLLDCCPAGPILLVAGARTVIAWDRLALLELVEG